MIEFFVAGTPIPKGSAKGFVVKTKKTGKLRAVVTHDNGERQKPWASAISFAAQGKVEQLIQGPVSITISFTMPRLKGHFGTGKKSTILKPDAPRWHISKPDLDKLIRCLKDALTGVVWKDDSQVVEVSARKQYGDRPGAMIYIEEVS